MSFKHITEEEKSRGLAILAVSVVVILLIIYGANGLRGSDQFWYVADVMTINQFGSDLTNSVYPGQILREGYNPEATFFMHNGPILYLVAALAKITDAYSAWIILNSTAHFLIALCIFLTLRRLVSKEVTLSWTLLYLVSPMALWQSINPSQEPFVGLLVAISLVLYCLDKSNISRFLLVVTLIVGVLVHPLFKIISVLYGLYLLASYLIKRRIIASVLSCVNLLVVFWLANSVATIFPSSFPPNLSAIITSKVPGKGTMNWHFSYCQAEIDLQLILAKVQLALESQFIKITHIPLNLIINASFVAFLLLMLFRFRRYQKLLIAGLILLGLHIVMVVLQANDPRDQQLIVGIVFVLVAIASKEFGGRLKNKIVVSTFIVSFIAVDGVMMHKARTDSTIANKQVSRIQDELSFAPGGSRFVAYNMEPDNVMSYILRPNKVLFIRTNSLEPKLIARTLKQFNPNYALSTYSIEEFNNGFIKRLEDSMFGKIYVYSLDN